MPAVSTTPPIPAYKAGLSARLLDWRVLDFEPGQPYCRGIGVSQMAQAIREGGKVLTSPELGYHVLEVLMAVSDSSTRREFVTIRSAAELLGGAD